MRGKQWRDGLLIGFLLLVIGWLGYLILGLSGKALLALHEAKEVRLRYEALEARRMVLEHDLANLDTVRGQEAAIRESFGVAKPGEEVIVLLPPSAPTTTPERPWWQKLWELF